MTSVDRLLQRWRIAKARPHVSPGARVLDLGCGDGAMFKQWRSYISWGVGIDPTLNESVKAERYTLIAGRFPDDLPESETFDAITMLAVMEHIPTDLQSRWAAECIRRLRPGGSIIITVPSPVVDRILAVLQFFRVIDGMSLEEHYGFDPRHVPGLFESPGVSLAVAKTFQLGCNNLYVFRKSGVR